MAYDGEGFLEKNRDTLNFDLLEMLQKSKHSFLNLLYPPDMTLSTTERKASLGKQFTSQLEQLMRQLYASFVIYTRLACYPCVSSTTPPCNM